MRDASPFVLVLTTWPVDHDPAALARTLVEERLAACVSILAPMQSVYRWKGAIDESLERQIVIKTATTQVEALVARIAALHPYEVPELLTVALGQGSEAYLDWMAANVQTV